MPYISDTVHWALAGVLRQGVIAMPSRNEHWNLLNEIVEIAQRRYDRAIQGRQFTEDDVDARLADLKRAKLAVKEYRE